MAQIEIGVGVFIVGAAGLGWLAGGLVNWALVVLGLLIILHGVQSMGIRFRKPYYKEPESQKDSLPEVTPGIEFYDSRSDMIEKRGGLGPELRSVSRAWVAFETGGYFTTLDTPERKKIDRMVVLDPNSDLLQSHARDYGDREGTYASVLKTANRIAREEGIPVKWNSKPLLNVVIGDPDTPDAWARVQVHLYHAYAARWPNFVVYRKEKPELFETIKKAYESMWEDSHDPQSGN